MNSRTITWSLVLAAALVVSLAAAKAMRRPSARAAAHAYRAELQGVQAESARLFEDVSDAIGVSFVHDADAHGRFYLPEEMGPGVGLFDYDGDGALDLFLAGGGSITGEGPAQTCRLYRNEQGFFRDVTEQTGAGVAGPAFGVHCADYDDDGDVDVFVTRLGPNVLLRNDAGRFHDVAAECGLADAGFGSGAVFFDYDRDGRLDLYVNNYVDWNPLLERPCYMAGVRDYCDPSAYSAPAQGRLYHQIDGGRFEDVTARAGIDSHRGHGLGVVAEDFDGDGHTDLYVANDSTPAFLWKNLGDGRFEENALRAGCAYNGLGSAIAGMGIACEDLDGDGRFDLFITNIRDQSHLALLNRGATFLDASARLGLPRWSVPATGFGVAVFDQDLDGALDVYVANGAVNLAPERIGSARPYVEPDQFARMVDGRFVALQSGSGAVPDESGRGLAAGDIDGDGDIDLVVTSNDGRAHVLRNLQSSGHAWLVVDARRPSGAAAIGAQVRVLAGGKQYRRAIRAQSSYLSSSQPRAHFGLGRAPRAEEVEVLWGDGSTSLLRDVELDRVVRMDQERR